MWVPASTWEQSRSVQSCHCHQPVSHWHHKPHFHHTSSVEWSGQERLFWHLETISIPSLCYAKLQDVRIHTGAYACHRQKSGEVSSNSQHLRIETKVFWPTMITLQLQKWCRCSGSLEKPGPLEQLERFYHSQQPSPPACCVSSSAQQSLHLHR